MTDDKPYKSKRDPRLDTLPHVKWVDKLGQPHTHYTTEVDVDCPYCATQAAKEFVPTSEANMCPACHCLPCACGPDPTVPLKMGRRFCAGCGSSLSPDALVPCTCKPDEHCPCCNDDVAMCSECSAWLSPDEYRMRLRVKRTAEALDAGEFMGVPKAEPEFKKVSDPPPKPGLKTEGQRRVGLDFNPSHRVDVHVVKSRFAITIDEMLAINTRAAAYAATQAEAACMWAVKALTQDWDK